MSINDDIIEIKIDFQRGIGDPSRVFRAMTGLIESTQSLDEHLASTLCVNVKTSLVLQDVEVGSIKAKLKTFVEDVPDEALKDGDFKKVFGHYLCKAKHKVIDWCSGHDEIKDIEEVESLKSEILELAELTDAKRLPAYAPIETDILLEDIRSINEAINYLENADTASYSSSEGESIYNSNMSISSEIITEITTKETITTENKQIVKVKKPDFLGTSRWTFKYSDHLIEAKILHEEWLSRFHKRDVIVQPGDSLRVMLREETSHGYNSEIIQTHYEIVEVLEILPSQGGNQDELF